MPDTFQADREGLLVWSRFSVGFNREPILHILRTVTVLIVHWDWMPVTADRGLASSAALPARRC
jgi:hypothetical protein